MKYVAVKLGGKLSFRHVITELDSHTVIEELSNSINVLFNAIKENMRIILEVKNHKIERSCQCVANSGFRFVEKAIKILIMAQ